MPAKFPTKRPDGSFSLELRFRTQQAVEDEIVQRWVSNWVGTNQVWIRVWRGPKRQVMQTDVLRWFDNFSHEPSIIAVTTETLLLRLDAIAGAIFWKDWMVRLIEAIIAEFPALVFEGARNVD